MRRDLADMTQLSPRLLSYPGPTGIWGSMGQDQGRTQVLDHQAKEWTSHVFKKN